MRAEGEAKEGGAEGDEGEERVAGFAEVEVLEARGDEGERG